MSRATSRRGTDLSMDRTTSMAVCRGVGDSLRKLTAAEDDGTALPDRLRELVEELRRRDSLPR
ncbi:hypothetical protein [Bradyrhizobium sp. WD16]|uniref:hypothetical protein n=1 Tax=Bradyrhizobium sp. WD16 TaxID=1521768 RepID=UPI0020A5BCCB|nr:hypothetical protein [Bradyrhizobium sp. WD16]UTD29423.1 hypothetical protein DB459_23435 [Bradyrhizobium sp. WD16]